MQTEEALLTAKWALIAAIRSAAREAADFECSANNYDRPIAETPWLRDHRYGNDEYDARWYAVHNAKTHFVEGLAGRIEDALKAYTAIAYMAGAAGAGEGEEP
jgi:hypothetical protein